MATIIARGTREVLETKLRCLEPTFYEFIPLTLEEIFISEMEEKGYDCTKVLG